MSLTDEQIDEFAEVASTDAVASQLRYYRDSRAALAARLAEVEAERDEAVKLAYERIERQNVETGKRVDLIHEREAFRAERDRLAQELEDTLDRAREAIAYLRIVLEGGHSGAAREFLARFPREGDGDS